MFEAPDLELMMDPDTDGAGDAVFLALGGWSALVVALTTGVRYQVEVIADGQSPHTSHE